MNFVTSANLHKKSRGFTLIELIVTISIMFIMTSVVIFDYHMFNDDAIISTLAYDISLTIRQAQDYGINVKEQSGADQGQQISQLSHEDFNHAYGVHFDLGTPTKYFIFLDQDGNGQYNPGPPSNDSIVALYNLQAGNTINQLCVYPNNGVNSTYCSDSNDSLFSTIGPGFKILDITFKRPDPDAIVKSFGSDNNPYHVESQLTAQIEIKSPKGIYKLIVVEPTGQISVQ